MSGRIACKITTSAFQMTVHDGEIKQAHYESPFIELPLSILRRATANKLRVDNSGLMGIEFYRLKKSVEPSHRPNQKEVSMEVRDISEIAKERKKGQRRIDLYRRENLETWVLIFPPGDVQKMHNHPSDRTYYVLNRRDIIKCPTQPHRLP